MEGLASVLLKVVSAVFALLAVFAAVGWVLTANQPHALGWLAASFLAYVLSTIPYGPAA